MFTSSSIIHSKLKASIEFKDIETFSFVGKIFRVITKNNEEFTCKLSDKKKISEFYAAFLSKYGDVNIPPLQVLHQTELSHLEELQNYGTVLSFPAGATIVALLDTVPCLYQILSGDCRLISGTDKYSILEEINLSDGDFFGEYSFLCGEFPVSAVFAVSDCKVVAFDRKNLAEFTKGNEALAHSLLAFLAESISENVDSRFKLRGTNLGPSSLKQPRSKVQYK